MHSNAGRLGRETLCFANHRSVRADRVRVGHDTLLSVVDFRWENSDDPFLFFSILCAFTLTPGLLMRTVTVGNLQLTLVLCALFYHRLLVWDRSTRPITSSDAAWWGFLTGCIIVTHYFNVTLIVVGVVFLLLRKAYRAIPIYLFLSVVIPLPWFAFNYFHYGSLTGWKFVYSPMMDIVNPDRTPYSVSTVLDQLVPRFFHIFWNPQESKRMILLSDLASKYLSGMTCFAVLGIGVWQLKKLVKKESWQSLDILCVLGVILNFLLLVYMSLANSVPCVMGRYLYLSLWPLIFLTYRFFVVLPALYRRAIGGSLIICAAMLTTNFLAQVMVEQLKPLQ